MTTNEITTKLKARIRERINFLRSLESDNTVRITELHNVITIIENLEAKK